MPPPAPRAFSLPGTFFCSFGDAPSSFTSPPHFRLPLRLSCPGHYPARVPFNFLGFVMTPAFHLFPPFLNVSQLPPFTPSGGFAASPVGPVFGRSLAVHFFSRLYRLVSRTLPFFHPPRHFVLVGGAAYPPPRPGLRLPPFLGRMLPVAPRPCSFAPRSFRLRVFSPKPCPIVSWRLPELLCPLVEPHRPFRCRFFPTFFERVFSLNAMCPRACPRVLLPFYRCSFCV